MRCLQKWKRLTPICNPEGKYQFALTKTLWILLGTGRIINTLRRKLWRILWLLRLKKWNHSYTFLYRVRLVGRVVTIGNRHYRRGVHSIGSRNWSIYGHCDCSTISCGSGSCSVSICIICKKIKQPEILRTYIKPYQRNDHLLLMTTPLRCLILAMMQIGQQKHKIRHTATTTITKATIPAMSFSL